MLFLLIFVFMTSSSFAMDNSQMMNKSCNKKKSDSGNQSKKTVKKAIPIAHQKRIAKKKIVFGWRTAPNMQKLSESKTTLKKD